MDDDHECELVTPPTYKRACEHCKSRRLACSYTSSLDHDEPCEECSRTGWGCIAGPAKESVRERITYDRDWENDPWQSPKAPKVKKLPSCRRCRERNQPCSFSAGDKSEACTACDMADQICLPELETPQGGRKRKRTQVKAKTATGKDQHETSWGPDVFGQPAGKHATIIIGSASASSEDDSDFQTAPKRANTKPIVIGESSNSSDDDSDVLPPPKRTKTKTGTRTENHEEEAGTIETISTKFAHPVKFNHEGQEPCHFCTDIRFAMFGLGSMEVEVVVWNDGHGLDENGGGHRERGIENTRMCVECTTKRLPVVMCAKHELQPLAGKYQSADEA